MPSRSLKLYTLRYSKTDLDAVPEDDRYFFLMSTGLANELQMLSKMLAVIIESDPDDSPGIVNQANSAYAMLAVRMLAGRISEGWKILSGFSKKLKSQYEDHMSEEGRDALRGLRGYFNPGKGRSALITKVRDHVAFHSLRETVAAAYESLTPEEDLGDYLSETIGNTLYYTAEIMHYDSIRHLAGESDGVGALRILQKDALEQTSNFNTAIYGFALIFCERYLPHALEKLSADAETIDIRAFEEMKLSFFSELPTPSGVAV